jgi:starvation-inducible DNA-binding protein
MYDDAAEKVDEIAERILMLGGVPANKFSDYLKVAKVKEVSGVSCGHEAIENILETYGYLIGQERKLLSLASEANDDATASLMSDYLKEQEKTVWMLVAFNQKGSCEKK